MAKQPTVERALEKLRVLVRQPAPDPAPSTVWSGEVPDDLETEGFKTLYLFPEERRAWEQLHALLADDLRFEYMNEREIKQATWRFLCESHLRKGQAIVDGFIAEYGRQPREHLCFFPVHLLTVTKPVEIQGATLLPMSGAPTNERMRQLPAD